MNNSLIPYQLQNHEAFVLLRRWNEPLVNGKSPGKIPLEGNFGWNKNPSTLAEATTHLSKGYNYGVLTGNGLVVIDSDDTNLSLYLLEEFSTFTVKTTKGHHFYFYIDELVKTEALERNGVHYGHICGAGKYVVGANSKTSTGELYSVLRDIEIYKTTSKELYEALGGYRKLGKTKVNASKEITETTNEITNPFAKLMPEDKGDYYLVTCPECGKHEAYMYKNNNNIICNRQDKCCYRGNLRDLLNTVVVTDKCKNGGDNEAGATVNINNVATRDFNASITNYDQYANIKPQERHYPWLPKKGGLAMIYARAGIGKSQFALGVCRHLLQKKDFLSWRYLDESNADVNIAYLDGEMMKSEAVHRLIKHGIGCNNFKYISHDDAQLSLKNEDSVKLFFNFVEQQKIDIAVIDTISSVTRGIDILSAKDCGEIINKFLLECRQKKLTVIFLHHANKSELFSSYRGSSTIEDYLDTVIELKEVLNTEDEKDGFKLKFTKARSCERIYQKPRIVKLNQDSCGNYTWEMEDGRGDYDEVVELVRNSGAKGISSREIASFLNISHTMVWKHRKRMQDTGLIDSKLGHKDLLRLKQEEEVF